MSLVLKKIDRRNDIMGGLKILLVDLLKDLELPPLALPQEEMDE